MTTTTEPAVVTIPQPAATPAAGYLPGTERRASTVTVEQLRAHLADLPGHAPVLLRFHGWDGLQELPLVLVDWDGALTLESEHCGPDEDTADEQLGHGADPAWLRAAEQAFDRAREQTLQRQADEVNQLLADLGIIPISPAQPGADELIAAHLVAVDPERELWGIDATHDGQRVVLEVEAWECDGDYRTGPALTATTDVVPLRRHGVPGLDG